MTTEERQKELLRQRNLVIKYINEHNQHFDNEMELTDFMQENEIEYMFFESTQELFNYYTEEKYNVLYFDKIFFMKNGSILILLPY